MDASMNQVNLNSTERPITYQHPLIKGEFLKTYEEALSFSKLKLYEQLDFRNVKIYENDYIHEIFTKNKSSLPHLVFLHGFGGTSLTGIRLFSQLYSHYQIHALDTFGQGYSSRGNFKDTFTYEESRDYFVSALEEWRRALSIDKFYLVGHSFGGYLGTCYAEKYPDRIEKLILVSPAGTSEYVEEERGCGGRLFYCLGQKIYNINVRPSAAIRNCIFGNKILERAVNGRMKLEGRQGQVWKKYLLQLATQEQSSEVGFYRLFDWPVVPKETIEAIVRRNKFPFDVSFYFGDVDWMNRKGAERLRKEKRCKLTIVQNAGHQVVFDNPEELGEFIRQQLKKN